MPSQAETIKALLQQAKGGVDPSYVPQSPANVAPFGNAMASAVGLPDALKALRGEMTPEEAQGFAMTSALGLIPGAGEGEAAVARGARELPDMEKILQGLREALGSPNARATITDTSRPISRAAQATPDYGPPLTGGAPLSDEDIDRHLAANPGASIFDIAGTPAPRARPQPVAPVGPTSQVFGGDASAKAAYDKFIAPHFGEQEFADKYFNGMHSPEDPELTQQRDAGKRSSYQNIEFKNEGTDNYPILTWNGRLRDKDGNEVGQISREIDPQAGTAHHGYLSLNSDAQGSGIGKDLLRNQVDAYNKMGLNSVDLYANIDVGGYAWAKYGFLPDEKGLQAAQSHMNDRLVGMVRQGLDPGTTAALKPLINSKDPKSVWAISDITKPGPDGMPIGKKLLMDSGWNGTLDLKDPESMERFNGYVQPAEPATATASPTGPTEQGGGGSGIPQP